MRKAPTSSRSASTPMLSGWMHFLVNSRESKCSPGISSPASRNVGDRANNGRDGPRRYAFLDERNVPSLSAHAAGKVLSLNFLSVSRRATWPLVFDRTQKKKRDKYTIISKENNKIRHRAIPIKRHPRFIYAITVGR